MIVKGRAMAQVTGYSRLSFTFHEHHVENVRVIFVLSQSVSELVTDAHAIVCICKINCYFTSKAYAAPISI